MMPDTDLATAALTLLAAWDAQGPTAQINASSEVAEAVEGLRAALPAATEPRPSCPWHHPSQAWIRTGDTEGFCGSCNPLAALFLHKWQEQQNETLRAQGLAAEEEPATPK